MIYARHLNFHELEVVNTLFKIQETIWNHLVKALKVLQVLTLSQLNDVLMYPCTGDKDWLRYAGVEVLKSFENNVTICHRSGHTVPRLGMFPVITPNTSNNHSKWLTLIRDINWTVLSLLYRWCTDCNRSPVLDITIGSYWSQQCCSQEWSWSSRSGLQRHWHGWRSGIAHHERHHRVSQWRNKRRSIITCTPVHFIETP